MADIEEENCTVKALLAMLRVTKDDFVFNQQQTIGAQQEAIGARLLRNLEQEEGSPPRQRSGSPPAAMQSVSVTLVSELISSRNKRSKVAA